MKFNQQLNTDITSLKRLRKMRNRERYLQRKRIIANKYNVTIRAVELWLNQRMPGRRKGRNDADKPRNKVMPKEKKLARELLSSGMEVKKAKNIIELETKKPVSTRKMNHIRDRVEKDLEIVPTETEESNFGDRAKQLFEDLFEMKLIAPNHGVGIKVNGRRFVIPKEDIDDVCLILANAYNRTAANKLKVDREQLLRQRIFHLIEQQVRLASSDIVNTKSIEAITRMYDRMIEKLELDANIRTVEKICKELKPDITWSEVGALIRKYADGIE